MTQLSGDRDERHAVLSESCRNTVSDVMESGPTVQPGRLREPPEGVGQVVRVDRAAIAAVADQSAELLVVAPAGSMTATKEIEKTAILASAAKITPDAASVMEEVAKMRGGSTAVSKDAELAGLVEKAMDRDPTLTEEQTYSLVTAKGRGRSVLIEKRHAESGVPSAAAPNPGRTKLDSIAAALRESDPSLTHEQAVTKALTTSEGKAAWRESREVSVS